MKTPQYQVISANQAVAKIAYKTNEVIPVYPITPTSEMSELSEQWSAKKQQNIFGSIPSTYEMQSEAGVAGTMHGALQTGALSTTFTASQGLLLMLPNMYKIAGELTPNVIHVATRSIATHALSVFGDHSDIMAVRQSGYAFLASASVQQAQDFALIAQAATLKSRIPFVHFFDGFRTSHEVSKIEKISDEIIDRMICTESVQRHRGRALSPDRPVLKGTSQGPDTFFQSREAVNSFYNACPEIVQKEMNHFATLTGRAYKLLEYTGHPKAKHIIIAMASSTETIAQTIQQLNKKGEKLGLITVHLYRPFSTKHLLEALPKSCKKITVLDRTKEPGSSGEPLYSDIVQSITQAFQNKKIKYLPTIVGGRYGLSSKEFTPAMVNAVFNNLKQKQPKHNFTVGIKDDVTHLSLPVLKEFKLETNSYEAIFYGEKCESFTKGFNKVLNFLGNMTATYVQGYTSCDYKKSNTPNKAHLRIAEQPIKAPYLIEKADFIACQHLNFIFQDGILEKIKKGGTLLINSSRSSKELWEEFPAKTQQYILNKGLQLFLIDLETLADTFFNAFLSLNNYIQAVDGLKNVDFSKYGLSEFSIDKDDTFAQTILGKLLQNKGDDLPVSVFPVDGTYPTHTSIYNLPVTKDVLPKWNMDLCTQCGACSMVCPQAALRIKVFDNELKEQAPKAFDFTISEDFDLMNYTLQINPEQCNGCSNCIDACNLKALTMVPAKTLKTVQQENWDFFETIPEFDRTKINVTNIRQQQLQEPLFKYSSGVEGCGEAPYLKLLSQLFGERLLVANATGASSIFGGALPTTPWAQNKEAKGPAWANSLFEDNAEFGLGFRLSLDQQQQQAKKLLIELAPELNFNLAQDTIRAVQKTELQINAQHKRVEMLKQRLLKIESEKADSLLQIIDSLIKKSVWCLGGDGWAYDIGYGGLDHVLASGKNINMLVLDNEVYDNTGGQASKATPYGAEAAFAFGGNKKQKKDLGYLAMQYDNVYVASVAIGADQEQTLKAFVEAEKHEGPSIIIAYCHSKSHGIDMKNPAQYHKAAVASGQWLLYRNNPVKKVSLQLDSKTPSIPIEAYLRLEKRFARLFDSHPDILKQNINYIQHKVNQRYEKYRRLACISMPAV